MPQSVPAGRYLVTLENRTADQEVEPYFGILPASVSVDQVVADLNSESDVPPAYLYDDTWAGGPNPYAGQTDAVVVDLTEGPWVVLFDRQTESDTQPADTGATFQVTPGTTATPTAIPGAIAITMKEYSFELPATIAAGPQIWDLTNSGAQPHFVVLASVPEGTTSAQMMASVAELMTGTPAADAVPEDQIQGVYDTAFISSGQHLWIQVDLDPGTYVAVCFFPDKESGQPHAMLGMVQVFTVG